jgi:serine/threonine-protein kinase HipA
LLTRQGWRLSPLYDVNPNPQARGFSLNISEFDNSLSFELAISQAKYYGVSQNAAITWVREAVSLVAQWDRRAKALGLGRTSIEALRPAFSEVRKTGH